MKIYCDLCKTPTHANTSCPWQMKGNKLREAIKEAIDTTQDWGYDETNFTNGIDAILDVFLEALPDYTDNFNYNSALGGVSQEKSE